MNKRNLIIGFFASVILFACSKESDDVAARPNEAAKPHNVTSDTANLPHYNPSNTPLVNWDQLPAQLRSATVIKDEAPNKAARVSESAYAWYGYATSSWGGTGGGYFSILPPPGSRIYAIALRTGALVDKILVWYITPLGTIYRQAGGEGGSYQVYYFASDERINHVYVKYGGYVDRLVFYTNKRSFGGGGTGGAGVLVSAPIGRQILGFYGRSGTLLDRIGFYVYSI